MNMASEFLRRPFCDLYHEGIFLILQDGLNLVRIDVPKIFALPENELNRLWEPDYFRVFLSHKAEYKKETAKLKYFLLNYGITCFVAHDDIEPTKEWQDEIEKALFSMDAMVALLTDDFHESNWTDQEIGFSMGMNKLIIPVNLGRDPYGFIGKYQAINGKKLDLSILAQNIFEILFKKPETKDKIIETLITRFEKSTSFDHSRILMVYLTQIESASRKLINRLENAPKNNFQVEGCNKVKKELPALIEKLKSHL